MTPDRFIPVATALPTEATWRQFATRLTNWVAAVAQSFTSQILRQVVVESVPPSTAPFSTGTVPFLIDADTDGTARALLIADNVPIFFVQGVPGALQWSMDVGASATTITLGTPASLAWFAFLVAR